MNISVFGLGYVGCTTAACLAKMAHKVIGVDINKDKVDAINGSRSPIVEPLLEDVIKGAVEKGNLSATQDVKYAVQNTDIGLICVGTPSKSNGNLNCDYIKRAAGEIASGLVGRKEYFVLAVRSTVLPGTIEEVLVPIVEEVAKKKLGVDFGVCMNPEFMREGTSVEDFFHPPKIVVGDSDRKAGDRMEEMYKGLNLPVIRTSLKVAEMIKYADNTFHAVKVTFANEIGNICKKSGIDSHKVMEIFCKDTKLNLSPYYLKPGFAFGGSCLPKDIRAIRYRAKIEDVETPLLSSVMVSNYNQIITVVNKLLEFRGKKLGFIGLSFKKDTDDMRESPVVEVIETMIGKGFNVRIFDDNVTLTNLVGANRAYIEREIPHLARLLCDSLEEIFKGSDVIIISKKWEGLVSCIKSLKEGQTVIDLVRIAENYSEFGSGKYYGICW